MLRAVVHLNSPEGSHKVDLCLEDTSFVVIRPQRYPDIRVVHEDSRRLQQNLIGPAQQSEHIEVVAFKKLSHLPGSCSLPLGPLGSKRHSRI